MKKVTLSRFQSTPQGTFGRLIFGQNEVYTTELPWRDNLPQKSCIPAGGYLCQIVNSPRFGRVYGVLNVPGRSNVLIHAANFGGDVDQGYATELHGCIAPCLKIGFMRNSTGVMQAAGLISRPALNTFMSWADRQPFELEIK